MRSMSLVVVRKLNSRVERGISQSAPTILLFSRMREEGTREQMILRSNRWDCGWEREGVYRHVDLSGSEDDDG